MREFFDAILAFIGSESLTDDEFNGLPEGLAEEYTVETYKALKAVLQARDGVSGQLKRLKSLYESKGVDVSGASLLAASQIFFGAPL